MENKNETTNRENKSKKLDNILSFYYNYKHITFIYDNNDFKLLNKKEDDSEEKKEENQKYNVMIDGMLAEDTDHIITKIIELDEKIIELDNEDKGKNVSLSTVSILSLNSFIANFLAISNIEIEFYKNFYKLKKKLVMEITKQYKQYNFTEFELFDLFDLLYCLAIYNKNNKSNSVLDNAINCFLEYYKDGDIDEEASASTDTDEAAHYIKYLVDQFNLDSTTQQAPFSIKYSENKV